MSGADACLATLPAALPRLATLNLQGCSRVGDAGITHLRTLPDLRHILLPAAVADASMQTLAELPGGCRPGLPGASALSPCCCISCDLHLMAVCCEPVAALERVALRGCTRVTTAGIYMLLQVRLPAQVVSLVAFRFGIWDR